jgi:ComEC/Rec2-related protein
MRDEADRGTAFLFLPVFLAIGALVYYRMPFEPGWTWIAGLAVLLVATCAVSRTGAPIRRVAVALFVLLAGMTVAKIEVWRAGTQMNGSEVATRVTGSVVAIQHLPTGRVRLTLDLLATERPELRYAPGRIRLTARTVPEGIGPGTIVHGVARVMPLSGPVRPGGYDFAFHSYFDGIGAVGFFYYDPEIVDRPAGVPPPGARLAIANWVEGLRMTIAERIRARLDGAEGEVAATLIAGVRSGIPEETAEAMRRTGLAHVLSISGLHMALVAGTVLLGFRVVFGLMPAFASRHPVRKYGAVGALLACGFYLGISGAEVAAQRSFVMISVMLVAVLFDRAALSLRNLAISAIIVIALRPHEVTGPSFQMSFAATAALIGAYALWRDRRRKPARFDPHGSAAAKGVRTVSLYLFGLAMTSVVAGLATAIFGAYHFNRISPLSLPANLAAMPAVSTIVMPFAVAATLAMPFGLEGLFLDIMGAGLRYVNAVAKWFSDRTVLDAVGAIPGTSVLVLTAGILAVTMFTTWWRATSLPLFALGMAMLAGRDLPMAMISENARLVAVRTADGELAVNRNRPNAFTMQNWLHASAASTVSGPRNGESAEIRRIALGPQRPTTPEDGGFLCADGSCMARTPDGLLVLHVPDAAAAEGWCGSASVIVIDDATAQGACPARTEQIVLTSRDLARRGSAEIHLRPDGSLVLTHAVAEPYRPWHRHRHFSREARGLPPYERPQSADAAE